MADHSVERTFLNNERMESIERWLQELTLIYLLTLHVWTMLKVSQFYHLPFAQQPVNNLTVIGLITNLFYGLVIALPFLNQQTLMTARFYVLWHLLMKMAWATLYFLVVQKYNQDYDLFQATSGLFMFYEVILTVMAELVSCLINL